MDSEGEIQIGYGKECRPAPRCDVTVIGVRVLCDPSSGWPVRRHFFLERFCGPRHEPYERFTWPYGLLTGCVLSMAALVYVGITYNNLQGDYNKAANTIFHKAYIEGVTSDPGMACMNATDQSYSSQDSNGSVCTDPTLLCTTPIQYAPAPAPSQAPAADFAPAPAPGQALGPLAGPTFIDLSYATASDAVNVLGVIQALIDLKKITGFRFSLVNASMVSTCDGPNISPVSSTPCGDNSPSTTRICSCRYPVVKHAQLNKIDISHNSSMNVSDVSVNVSEVVRQWWRELEPYTIADVSLLTFQAYNGSATKGWLQIQASDNSYIWLDLDQTDSNQPHAGNLSNDLSNELIAQHVSYSGCQSGVYALGFRTVRSYACASGVRLDQLHSLNELITKATRAANYPEYFGGPRIGQGIGNFSVDLNNDQLQSTYIAFLGALIGLSVSSFMLLLPLLGRCAIQICFRIGEPDEVRDNPAGDGPQGAGAGGDLVPNIVVEDDIAPAAVAVDAPPPEVRDNPAGDGAHGAGAGAGNGPQGADAGGDSVPNIVVEDDIAPAAVAVDAPPPDAAAPFAPVPVPTGGLLPAGDVDDVVATINKWLDGYKRC